MFFWYCDSLAKRLMQGQLEFTNLVLEYAVSEVYEILGEQICTRSVFTRGWLDAANFTCTCSCFLLSVFCHRLFAKPHNGHPKADWCGLLLGYGVVPIVGPV